MPMTSPAISPPCHSRSRHAGEDGFVMLIVIGALLITGLLITAFFISIQGDVHATRHDLDGKRAYAAALAGANAFLYQINQNSSYWQTCSNDVVGATAVQGSSTGEQYSYTPVFNSGYTSANCSTNPIAALVDKSGTLRYEFTGYSGNPQVKRTVVSSFSVNTPLDYLWYTQYEALDASISSTYSGCDVYYRNGRPSVCNIDFVSGDVVNGPMYTQDQFSVSGSPTFGRNSNDAIASEASQVCQQAGCGSAIIKGKLTPNAKIIPIPTDNSQLETDATAYGKVYSGTTSITLKGTVATVVTCPGTTSTSANCSSPSTVDLTQDPIIYVQNASGCTPYNYSPFNVSYNAVAAGYYGCSGDVYISGNYTTPVTIAAANNIIVDGNLTTTTDSGGNLSGTATLALVANRFVRLMHGVTAREYSSADQCQSAADSRVNVTNVAGQTLTNPTIDAAILAIQHSFIVDNYDCGGTMGTLTVDGALAQEFRGTVGTHSGSTITNGYVKAYAYDDRLKVLLPPFLFDIAHAGWRISRETLCTPGGTDPATAC